LNFEPGVWFRVNLGLMPYPEALALQHTLAAARSEGRLDRDVLLLVEHPPVYTLGRRGGRDNLTVSESFLDQQGIGVIQAERGGDITYHGPGQQVAYPILALDTRRLGVADYVGLLEDAMIRTASDFGVTAHRSPANRGVWVGKKKLGSIGIAVRRGVAFHGMALNVNPTMRHFGWINPCGLAGVAMTSLHRETGGRVAMDRAREAMNRHLASLFDVAMEEKGVEDLLRDIDP
jgi:lipoyl(octanoyl) transferase